MACGAKSVVKHGADATFSMPIKGVIFYYPGNQQQVPTDAFICILCISTKTSTEQEDPFPSFYSNERFLILMFHLPESFETNY